MPGLPESSLSLFGLTSLPSSYVEVLVALERPSRSASLLASPVSGAVGAGLGVGGLQRRVGTRRRDDPSAGAIRATRCSRPGDSDSREMQLVLLSETGARWEDHHRRRHSVRRVVLERIQADVRAEQAPAGTPLPGDEDHAGGSGRLGRGASRSTLAMEGHVKSRCCALRSCTCSRIIRTSSRVTFSSCAPTSRRMRPSIHAAFDWHPDERDGDQDDSDHPDLRVRLADRAIRQVNPLFGVVSRLLDMAGGRVSATEVLDLAGLHTCQAQLRIRRRRPRKARGVGGRFGCPLGTRCRASLAFPVGRAGGEHMAGGTEPDPCRRRYGRRKQRLFGGVLPLDDVGSRDIEFAGRLAELVDRIEVSSDGLSGQKTIEQWTQSIATSVEALASVGPGDEWQSAQLGRLLGGSRRQCHDRRRAEHVELGLGDVRADPRGPPARSAHESQLPHGPPDGLHPGPDAFSSPQGRVPARVGRRGISTQPRARR